MKQSILSGLTKIIEKVNIKTCVVVFVALMTIPILLMSFFSFPIADDLDYSIKIKEAIDSGSFNFIEVLGIAFESVVNKYMTWQGTYTSMFIMALQPGIYGEQFYFLTTWILVFISLIGFLYSGKKLLQVIQVDSKTALFISLLIWYFYIQTIPDIKEGLFWYNGAMHYLLFLVLTLVLVANIINQYNFGTRYRNIAINSILGFLISGGNTVTAFASILLMVLVIIYILVFDKIKRKIMPIFFPLLSSIVGFVIMLIAPGNAVRQQFVEFSPSVYATISEVAFTYFDFAYEKWLSFSFGLFLILLTPFMFIITKKIKGFSLVKFAIVVVSQYVLVCAMLCVIHYGVGHFAAGRVMNAIYPVFFISMIIIYGYIIGLLQQHEIVTVDFLKLSRFNKNLTSGVCALIILIAIFFLGSNNYQYSTSGMALAEFRGGTPFIYKQQMQQRMSVLKDESVTDVVFEPHISSVFFGNEILSEDSSFWTNIGLSEYYNKTSVSLVSSNLNDD